MPDISCYYWESVPNIIEIDFLDNSNNVHNFPWEYLVIVPTVVFFYKSQPLLFQFLVHGEVNSGYWKEDFMIILNFFVYLSLISSVCLSQNSVAQLVKPSTHKNSSAQVWILWLHWRQTKDILNMVKTNYEQDNVVYIIMLHLLFTSRKFQKLLHFLYCWLWTGLVLYFWNIKAHGCASTHRASTDWVSLRKNYLRNDHVFFFLFVCSFYCINLYEITCQLVCKFLVVRWPWLAFSFYEKAILWYSFNCIFLLPTLNRK